MKKRHGLPEIMRAFKSFSARRINELRGTPGARVWERSYYDHIIRNERAWARIRAYIRDNPRRWEERHSVSEGGISYSVGDARATDDFAVSVSASDFDSLSVSDSVFDSDSASISDSLSVVDGLRPSTTERSSTTERPSTTDRQREKRKKRRGRR